MLTGYPPFYSDNRDELFEQIKFGAVKFPSKFSPSIKDLLCKLFIKDPDQRLGEIVDMADKADGTSKIKIKTHSWFVGINWDALLNKKIKAPFVPVIKDENDVSNFDRVRMMKFG